MIKIEDTSHCSGCTACASICGKDAITMKPDSLGFLFPEVDMEKCVHCGACIKVCPFNDDYDTSLNLPSPRAYGVRHKNEAELMASRSGAAFIALSDQVLYAGGVVYGAGYKDHFRVSHKRAANKDQRDEFRGSKYVQSDLTGIFRQVKEDLKSGCRVMFCGTPCQTAGLHSYIGKALRKNLILVDIICHGAPSPYVWRDYIQHMEAKHGAEIVSLSFRDKAFGWDSHFETFTFSDGSTAVTSAYRDLFYKEIMCRESCSVCKYANTARPSDITIGDFWGWEKSNPKFNADDKGVSLVILNTEIGVTLFEEAKADLLYFSVKLRNALQRNLCFPTPAHPARAKFVRDYVAGGFNYVFAHYGTAGWRHKAMQFCRKVTGRVNKLIGYVG